MNRLVGEVHPERGGPVRVELKINRSAGPPLSGRDVLRILTASKTRVATKPEIQDGTTTPEATEAEKPAVLSTGALAADVCRHIWAERGRFAPILYGSM